MRIPIEKKSYLIIDDLGDMRAMLRSMLGMFGVTRSDIAANGKDAIALLEKNRYDVVLCDYNLGPGKDGQQVLEEARERGLITLATVFIMLTAENTRDMVMGAIEYEPDCYLSKPFTKDLLRSRLEKILTKKNDLEAVDLALDRKDYAEAIRQLDLRIAESPKNLGELMKLKAEVCWQSGALDTAQAIYEQVLAVRQLAWARLGMGKILFTRQKYRQAREIFQELINTHQDLTAAYDWLARTQDALGDARGAQEVLASAVALSPKAILRQKALGEIAARNGDFAIAERAFGNAVTLGRHSIYKHPSLYARFVESQIENPEHKDKRSALLVVKQMEREFGRDPEAQFFTVMADAVAQQGVGNEAAAKESLVRANEMYEQLGGAGKPDLTLRMARTFAFLGQNDQAEAMFQSAIRNSHDNTTFLREVEHVYRASGLSEDPARLIEELRMEIVNLNNQGVQLAAAGQVDQAADLFEKAADGMAGNRIINLNAVKVLLMRMERRGTDADSLAKVRKYMDRIRRMGPNDPEVARLGDKFQKLLSRN